MDALWFSSEWVPKDSGINRVDEVNNTACSIIPEWGPRPVKTLTKVRGGNGRIVTQYMNPIVRYGNAKEEIFDIGEEIEGHPGVFVLTYAEGVPDELRRSEPKKSGSEGITSSAKKRRKVADSDS